MVELPLVTLKNEALRIRREIERASSELWAPFVGETIDEVWCGSVERRLILLVPRVERQDQQGALRAARKVGHVYRETSDVLHGRLLAAHFNENRVAEWEADLARFMAHFRPRAD